MSFIAQNKRWLLPFLGILAAGVLWMNLRDDGAPASAPAPAPAPPPVTEPATVDQPDGGGDLHGLEALPGSETDNAPLLLAGRQPIAVRQRGPAASPTLHPELWKALFSPKPPPAPVHVNPDPPGALPVVDFILESGRRLEAWVKGRGYREGDSLGGGYRLKRILGDGVVVTSSAGERRVPLRPSNPPRHRAGGHR